MGEIMNSKETSVFFCFEWVSDFSHSRALPVIQCAQSTCKPPNKGWLAATVGEICATDTYQPGESGPSLVAGDLTDVKNNLCLFFIYSVQSSMTFTDFEPECAMITSRQLILKLL